MGTYLSMLHLYLLSSALSCSKATAVCPGQQTSCALLLEALEQGLAQSGKGHQKADEQPYALTPCTSHTPYHQADEQNRASPLIRCKMAVASCRHALLYRFRALGIVVVHKPRIGPAAKPGAHVSGWHVSIMVSCTIAWQPEEVPGPSLGW